MAPKRRASQQELKKSLPLLKEFSKVAKPFLELLGQKVQQKERKVASIAVMVQGISRPNDQTRGNINIKTIDVKRSLFSSHKQQSSGQSLRWEDEVRRKRRGTIL